jgi:hypothetical protein
METTAATEARTKITLLAGTTPRSLPTFNRYVDVNILTLKCHGKVR